MGSVASDLRHRAEQNPLEKLAMVAPWQEALIRFLYQCQNDARPTQEYLEQYGPRNQLTAILARIFAPENLQDRDGRVLFPALLMLDALADCGDVTAIESRAAFLREYDCSNDRMLRVAAGEFPFGKGRKAVEVAAFEVDSFPVTNKEYEAMIPGHAKQRTECSRTPEQPVVNVCWWEAALYCRWSGARLPTEAEWEKAAAWNPVACEKREFPWGNEWDPDKCNTREKGPKVTTRRDTYLPGVSAYGRQDMAGNVWEWIDDTYKPQKPPVASLSRYERVLRGGAFDDCAEFARSSYRASFNPENRDNHVGVGFRRVRTL